MEDSELIRKYIRGQCSEDEQLEIRNRIKSDEAFTMLYEEERIVAAGIGLSERERLKELLKEKNSDRKKYLYVAAAMIPLLVLSYFILNIDPDYGGLYDQNYEPYGVYEFGVERGADQRDSLEVLAFTFYKEKNFGLALGQLEQLGKLKPEEGYFLYQGICLMELERTEEAFPIWDKISKESDYYLMSQWYRALGLLRLERIEECKSILRELKEEQGGLGKKSGQLLEEL